MEAGSFNAAISAQNSLLKVGGLIVDRKEVMFGKVDQMSRDEVEARLTQLMGNIVLEDKTEQDPDPALVDLDEKDVSLDELKNVVEEKPTKKKWEKEEEA
tara:strand:- start:224 stop:523 length:300 start_codon:yes stop_codon:yes gene_type:complete